MICDRASYETHSSGSVDLSLLVVLNRVYVERRRDAAAANLNFTQSAVSHTLRRLRESCVIRSSERHGTALVPASDEPGAAFDRQLAVLEQVVNSGNQFEPSAAARFLVGMDERLELFALPSSSSGW